MGNNYFSMGGTSLDLGNSIDAEGVVFGLGSQLGRSIGFTSELSIFDIRDRGYWNSSDISADGGGYSFSVGPEFYLAPNMSIYATAGVLHYSYSYTTSDSEGKLHDSTATFGTGVRFALGRALSLQLGYKSFMTDGLTTPCDTRGYGYTASLGFRF